MVASGGGRMRLSRWLVLAGCAVAALASAGPASAAGGLRHVTVDAARPVGLIRSLQGVSGSPLPGDASHADLSAQQRALGVDFVRTHDIDCKGTGDIDGAGANRIFPDFSADPDDPRSYNFGPTDRAILSIVRAGSEVLFNLGRSDLRGGGIAANTGPPPAPAVYASVARHVAAHYNDGWAHGYRLGIRYWEIWNEPDLTPFWSGTREQFYALYSATSRALKGLHGWMQVGGPALTTNNDLTGYRESLLAFIRAHRLPLDFWSIHKYTDFSNDPLDFNRLGDSYRRLLDHYGFRRAAIQLTEWNYGIAEQPTAMQRAAYVASSLVLMQRSQLSRAVYYRNDADNGTGFALATDDGKLTKAGAAFKAVAKMSRTPLRLAASGGDDQGFSVEAGRSRRRVRVLISNYEIPAADQGPLPFPDNIFAIPGIGTLTTLARRDV